MYDLHTLTLATHALINKKPLVQLDATNSATFNGVWEMYSQIIGFGVGHVHAHWMNASRSMNEPHVSMTPDSMIQIAARYIAGSYILCGYEMGNLHQQDPAKFAKLKPVAQEEISAHSKRMIDAVKKTHARINQLDLLSRNTNAVRCAIGEFYSLALVALYETRREVRPEQHPDINEILDLCEDALQRYPKESLISPTLAKHLAEQREFRLVYSGEPRQLTHQRQITGPAISPPADKEAVLASYAGEPVVDLDAVRKRLLALKAGKNLVDKRGGPK